MSSLISDFASMDTYVTKITSESVGSVRRIRFMGAAPNSRDLNPAVVVVLVRFLSLDLALAAHIKSLPQRGLGNG